MNWRIEQEEYYFKIYDSSNQLTGYFQPDFGDIQPKEKEEEIIQQMLKNHEEVRGGLLYIPMAKLDLPADSDYTLDYLLKNFRDAMEKISAWKDLLGTAQNIVSVRASKSHSDPDMLALLLEIRFPAPIRLKEDDISKAIQSTMNTFTERGLL